MQRIIFIGMASTWLFWDKMEEGRVELVLWHGYLGISMEPTSPLHQHEECWLRSFSRFTRRWGWGGETKASFCCWFCEKRRSPLSNERVSRRSGRRWLRQSKWIIHHLKSPSIRRRTRWWRMVVSHFQIYQWTVGGAVAWFQCGWVVHETFAFHQ